MCTPWLFISLFLEQSQPVLIRHAGAYKRLTVLCTVTCGGCTEDLQAFCLSQLESSRDVGSSVAGLHSRPCLGRCSD